MPKNPPDLTAERLRELLSYDPETGIFVWLVCRSPNAPAGAVAGTTAKNGYIRIKIDMTLHSAHRLAWLYVHGIWPADQIDHRNGIRSDNWIKNLREATAEKNQQNRALSRNNKSKRQGVCWDTNRKKWRAQIAFAGQKKHLGRFDSLEEAGEAYAKAKTERHLFQPVCRQRQEK